jgi:hypothetical protein
VSIAMRSSLIESSSISGRRPAAPSSCNFRMRYRVEAMTAPSILYDYYNPEANATVALCTSTYTEDRQSRRGQ